jgi:hypothetical protein
LLEYGGEYFNLKTFPDGEAKTDLLKVMNKSVGKSVDKGPGLVENRKKEKRKTSDPTVGQKQRSVPVPGPSTSYTISY